MMIGNYEALTISLSQLLIDELPNLVEIILTSMRAIQIEPIFHLLEGHPNVRNLYIESYMASEHLDALKERLGNEWLITEEQNKYPNDLRIWFEKKN